MELRDFLFVPYMHFSARFGKRLLGEFMGVLLGHCKSNRKSKKMLCISLYFSTFLLQKLLILLIFVSSDFPVNSIV